MWRTLVLLCNKSATKPSSYIPTRVEVLHLYRNLLKGRKTFEYTDKNYYTRRIRNEFKQNVDLKDKQVLAKAYEDGKRMLDTKYGGVV